MKQNVRFGLVLGPLGVLKISEIKLRYGTYEGSYVFMDRKIRELTSFTLYVESALKISIT